METLSQNVAHSHKDLHYYSAFGRVIASEVRLNELRGALPVAEPDVVIVKGQIGRPRPERSQGDYMDFDDPQCVFMVWTAVAGFKLTGNVVTVEAYPDIEERYLAFPILGPVMAWILHCQGLFLLHASAVDINGKTVTLMGDKLAGKSTTAAAFVRAGFPLITDDLVAIDFNDGGEPHILPAFAQLKLADDAAAAIDIEGSEAQPLIHKDFPKRQHKLAAMRSEPASVDWFLELRREGDEPGLDLFGLPDAIRAVNRFSYMPRFNKAKWTAADEAAHFRNCAKLASLAKVGRLSIPVGLDRLGGTVDFMVRIVGEQSP